MRDSCPAFLKEKGKVKALKFCFNGWAKYDNWKLDQYIPEKIAEYAQLNIEEAIYQNRLFVLEGGAIDYNGRGTLLTTEECLLDDKIQVRNPGFSKKDYEKAFKKFLGIDNVIWLGKGISGDDTHGHVDDLCRFVNEKTIITCRSTSADKENYSNLEENYERLQNVFDQHGQKIEVISIPMPKPLYFENMRLPASYANFYISNNAVLVPTFNDPNDRIALNILSEIFYDRKVIGLHAVDLVWGLGTIHCLSHEVPL